jgi:hypothetical protein
MIANLLFFLAMFVVGYLFLCLIAPSFDADVSLFLAPFFGMSVFVFGFVILLILPVPAHWMSFSLVLALCYSVVLFVKWHKNQRVVLIGQINLIKLGFALILYSILGSLCYRFANVSIGCDAYMTLGLSHYLANGGAPTEYLFYARQIFVPALHGTGMLFGMDEMFAIYPLTGIWFLGLLGAIVFTALPHVGITSGSKRFLLACLSAFALCSIGAYARHSFYVGDNLFSAIFFTVAVIGLYLYRLEKSRDWLTISGIFLGFFVLMRMENIFVSIIPILLFYWADSKRLKVDHITFFGLFYVIVLPWFIYGFFVIIRIWGHEIIAFEDKGPKLLAVMVIAFAFFGLLLLLHLYYLYGANWDKVRVKIPKWLISSFVLFLLLGTYLLPKHTAESIYNTIINLIGSSEWGITWVCFLAFLFIIAMFSKSKEKEFFMIAIVPTVILFFLTVYGRTPFRIGLGDSFNRMVLHVVPLIIIYICIEGGIGLKVSDKKTEV